MAQARAVVDVVRAKAGPNQFLKQIGLFIRAFRRAKASQGFGSVLRFEGVQTTGGHIQGLVPGGFPEYQRPVARITAQGLKLRGIFGRVCTADQGCSQAVGVVCVIKTETPLHAKT